MDQDDKKRFRVFVSYHVLRAEGGMRKFGNIVIVVDVNRNSDGYMPSNLTDQMIWQIRAQVAISENVDEELIYIANMFVSETTPGDVRVEEPADGEGGEGADTNVPD